MYRIHQIKLGLDEDIKTIESKIRKRLGNKDLKITDIEIVKESLDARDKNNIKRVYTVDFNAKGKGKVKADLAPNLKYEIPKHRENKLKNPPVICGFGPCGMFAGLILAEAGFNPIIIERGSKVEERSKQVERFWKEGNLDENSNVQFGEGGAGTFSDGKLTTGIKDPRIRKVLKDFVSFGADPDIMYKQKAHIGTDVLRQVVKNLRERIISLGGEIYFDRKMVEILTEEGCVSGIKTISTKEPYEEEIIQTENLVLAIGHSARDTFRYLKDIGILMEQKPFSMGVRIEHPQRLIDEAQYGQTKGLPPADYKLSYHLENGRGVYTFCMCPGGEVITASSSKGMVVTNGMSNRARNSGKANSGLLVDVRTEDFESEDPLAGVYFQEKYERLAFENGGGNYKAPKTTWGDFRKDAKSAECVKNSLPEFVVNGLKEAMPHLGKRLKGFDRDDAIITAVESRSSSPVRFPRNENLESNIKGLYPGGEGTGHAGGIMSAACDGIKIAEKIMAYLE